MSVSSRFGAFFGSGAPELSHSEPDFFSSSGVQMTSWRAVVR
jgi:hypothetical protein